MTDQLKVVTVPIASLTPDPENVRKHSEVNLDAIRRSLELFGQRKPVVVARGNKGQLVVVAGNGTMEAAQSLGWTELAVAEVPKDWDADKARAYAIADNRTAELADWDSAGLANALVDLDAVGWDSADLGFKGIDETIPETADALANSEDGYREQYGVIVMCVDASHQEQIYNHLKAEGHDCRVVTT